MGKSTIGAAQMGQGSADTTQAIALADPQGALDQFQKAASSIETQYPGALSAFQSYVAGGSKGALDQQTQAQLATLPVSSTATAALDELRGFMGLPSISPTAGLSTSVNGMINQLANDPASAGVKTQLEGIRDQLTQAEGMSDPTKREAAKAQLTEQLSGFAQGLGPEHGDLATKMQSIQSQFDVGYGNDPQSAWSPEVIQSKLESTPGYQFRMNQGLQAMERSAAAKGNLLSGNTLAAAQEYGQGMASQEYQNRLSQLQNTVGTNASSINQQAGLLQGAGNQMSQTGQQMGAAAGDTLKGIAGAGQQAGNLSGQGLLQAGALQGQMANQGQLANAQMQQQTTAGNAQLRQQAALANQQAGGASAGLVSQLLNKV